MTDDIRVKIHNDLIIKNIERETNYTIKCDYDFVSLNVDDVKVLLENCKKQSKEIEELKEDSCCMTNCVRRDKEKIFLEDKIKAKIEELEKQLENIELKHINEDKISKTTFYFIQKLKHKIEVLQLLLEKE